MWAICWAELMFSSLYIKWLYSRYIIISIKSTMSTSQTSNFQQTMVKIEPRERNFMTERYNLRSNVARPQALTYEPKDTKRQLKRLQPKPLPATPAQKETPKDPFLDRDYMWNLQWNVDRLRGEMRMRNQEYRDLQETLGERCSYFYNTMCDKAEDLKAQTNMKMEFKYLSEVQREYITILSTRVKRLEGEFADCNNCVVKQQNSIREADREIERLRKELKEAMSKILKTEEELEEMDEENCRLEEYNRNSLAENEALSAELARYKKEAVVTID